MYLRCTGKAIFKEICITKHAWELRTPFRSPPAAKEKLLFFSSFPLFRVNNFMREGKKGFFTTSAFVKRKAQHGVNILFCFFH